MPLIIQIIFYVWVGFSTAVTIGFFTDKDVTTHKSIIERCDKTNIIQYNNTVIECKLIKNDK